MDVVPPCPDEAEALHPALDRIPPGRHAIVVDNGSADGSADIASDPGAYVVREPWRGFGSGRHPGPSPATAAVVRCCDGDASLELAVLPRAGYPVLGGSDDLVQGHRRPTARRARPSHARTANLELARLIRRRTCLSLRELGPVQAARHEAVPALNLTDRHHPLHTVVRAAYAGLRGCETDVPYRPRTGRRSSVTGTRYMWQAVRDTRAVLTERPATGSAAAMSGAVA
ncbi:glycosyltransferase [Streptomyces canus]|uniref:glycosyltransferase family 2 protein n=1 Tax=Streptomyces canus TaxID=58343 RepID=UPI0036F11B76